MALAEKGFGLNGIGLNGYWPNWELDQVALDEMALDEMGLDEVAIPRSLYILFMYGINQIGPFRGACHRRDEPIVRLLLLKLIMFVSFNYCYISSIIRSTHIK